jgi:hypothetical protein
VSWLDTKPPEKVDAAIERLRARRGGHYYIDEYADGDERFGLWLALVDQYLGKALTIGFTDLADWGWRDSFDAGDSPREAVLQALEADDLYAGLLERAES